MNGWGRSGEGNGGKGVTAGQEGMAGPGMTRELEKKQSRRLNERVGFNYDRLFLTYIESYHKCFILSVK